ncbi:Pyruvate phosphate dikinase PEP/pyruvate binding subunit [Pseudomonas coronafaciens pv. porri]|nr:Pyruvate phosphate dikinase PEP/pyruvate binding subunit [Pseudomonas coronafaciens pv. porri]RMU83342.1 Pyruvate phosphate dikinase PEP/pyruvate binding subunit [Pseudomonas coronafaciens pv. porri]RMW02721.1 Pyruvate phosphate dikinase PEP/pyruvate binding subunit [Pseudomonas coronafaciens pv. porri]RMW13594.1 Pyruvate phosphate dikinase PEP/pyruvate binding subunit [Pseudomonas coronafaciens pv. porri]
MSSKYTTLQSLAHTLPVPPLGALSDADYCVLWKDFSARKQAIEDTLKTVRITAGAFLDEHMDRIARLAEFDWSDAADAHIEALLASGGFDNETELAVRSSANAVFDFQRYAGQRTRVDGLSHTRSGCAGSIGNGECLSGLAT